MSNADDSLPPALEQFFALVSGKAKPSDFGYDLIEAGILLATMSSMLENSINDLPYSLNKATAERMIIDARALARTYGEAGRLAGEDKND